MNDDALTIEGAVEDYLLHLREINRGARTAVEYRRYLRRLLDELRQLGLEPSASVGSLERRHLRAFSRALLRDGLADRTRATILSCVRSWLRYLTKEGHPVPPPDVVEVPRNPRTVPELDERLPETVELPPPPRRSDVADILALRDRALLLTLYSTQLRVSELCGLNRDQIDRDLGLAVVVGKGRKTRTVFFGPEALAAIDRYLDARADKHRPLFIRHDHNAPSPDPATDPDGDSLRLAVDTAEYVVRRAASARGIKATPHSYRHYGATAMIRAGMDLRSVQEALGHASVTTTQIYTHVNPKRLHDDWRRFHPAARTEADEG